MRRPNRWILATGAVLALVAAGAALPPPASATELQGLRVAAVPALPVANHPWRISVDFSGTGDPGWCRWQLDVLSGNPYVQYFPGEALDLWVYRAEPAAPCIEQIPHTVDFDVPAITIAPGYLPIRVRRHVGFLEQETLALAGVVMQPESTELALQANRFRLSVTYRDPRDGLWRSARMLRTSEASGKFWFFDPSNPEVLVKLLDGGAVNGHFWLFASSLTTLEFELRIVDSAGGCLNLPGGPSACPTRTYRQASGPSLNIEDVLAMPAAAAGTEPPLPAITSVELRLEPALPHRGDSLRILSNLGNDANWCNIAQAGMDISPDDHVLYLWVEDQTPPILPPPCGPPPPGRLPFEWEIDTASLAPTGWLHWDVRVAYWPQDLPLVWIARTGFELRHGTAPFLDPDQMLLQPEQPSREQFIARVDWSVPATGASGQGTPTVLSSDSGYFTFFDTGNVEVTIKVLDGRSINGHWWLFVASQTRLPYTLTLVRGFECALSGFPGPSCEVVEFEHLEGPPQNLVDIEAFAAAGP